ncbi:MAG: helix-turn-helix domain-containing protein [Gammaproteobacteria bacterium]|nr:helix-turn-helix domain-containing protein [Gammaproteobacteria bacterium]MCY4278867.1 helix-turn-helix domain-containing protein [Gammaproteobacteria bacterium]MCY4322580.1 helix-turn-helix domain-containing protein [Gammaproteobacteria bacterium]
MAKSYTHLTAKERYYIKTRLKAEDSRSEIARSIRWSPSTVSRELRRAGDCRTTGA